MKPVEEAHVLTDRSAPVSRRSLLHTASVGVPLLAVGLASACSSDPSGASDGAAGTPRRGGTLRLAIGDISVNDRIDPARATSSTAAWFASMVWSPLVRSSLDFELRPCLAESWEISENGTEWTFHLRSGVMFHDGTPLTARDAAWTYTRILDENVGSSLRSALADSLAPEGIEVVDDSTLLLRLLKPNVFLGQTLARYNAGIVKENQTEFDSATAIGTGPFVATSFTPGESFEVARNPSYFEEGLPYLDGIQNSKVDASTVLQALGSGSVDWTDALNPKSVAQIASDDRFKAPALDGDQRAVRTYFLHMKLDSPPFDDPRVVMAFKLAADRDAIRTAVLGNLGTITGDVPVPVEDKTYPPEVGERPQDIEQAKRLLSEAGFPDGIDVDLPTADFQPGMVDFSVAYAETVKAAGIRVNVQQVPVDTYFDRVFGQASLFHDYAQRLSAYTMLSNFFQQGGTYNGNGFDEDGALTEFLDRAMAETDEAAQTQILTDAMSYVADNSGTLIAFFVPIVETSRAQVQGDIYDPMFAWENIWISE